jgi:GR25 family glycosyltransferase involved in LPS biosynthesis
MMSIFIVCINHRKVVALGVINHTWMCLDRGFDRAIVFEDDILLHSNVSFQETCQKILAIEQNFPTWKRVTLHESGIFTVAPPHARETGVPSIIHARSLYTRCYAISKLGMQQMLAEGLTASHIDHRMYGSFFHDPTFAMQSTPLTYDNIQTCTTTDNSAWGEMGISWVDSMVNCWQQNEQVVDTILRSTKVLPASEETVAGHLINYNLLLSSGILAKNNQAMMKRSE